MPMEFFYLSSEPSWPFFSTNNFNIVHLREKEKEYQESSDSLGLVSNFHVDTGNGFDGQGCIGWISVSKRFVQGIFSFKFSHVESKFILLFYYLFRDTEL